MKRNNDNVQMRNTLAEDNKLRKGQGEKESSCSLESNERVEKNTTPINKD
jgi:hypothetical protein